MNPDRAHTLFEPHVFKDGRDGKYWIALPNEIDGPYDDRADAEQNLARLAQPTTAPAERELVFLRKQAD